MKEKDTENRPQDDDEITVPTGHSASDSPVTRTSNIGQDNDADMPMNGDVPAASYGTPSSSTGMSRFLGLWGPSSPPPRAAADLDHHDDDDNNSLDRYELARQSMSFQSLQTSERTAKIDFLADSPSDMTYARRIALSLMKYSWYYPNKDKDFFASESSSSEEATESNNGQENDNTHTTSAVAATVAPPAPAPKPRSGTPQVAGGTIGKPSLARAWVYFEHFSLPRYIVREKADAPKKNIIHRALRKLFCKADKELQRAEPGEDEHPTKLYSPIFTPLKQMGDWGIGVGLYYSTLRSITILTLVAGLLNIVNILYFNHSDYSANGQSMVSPKLTQGSAVCTTTAWVPCVDCSIDHFLHHRIATGTSLDGSNTTLTFALRNECNGATIEAGMIHYGTLWLVILGIVVMNYYQKYMEVKFDEDEQTAQDYSIVITNPPADATDPEEWREFFETQFGPDVHVTTCTVALDNDFLVRSLVERRENMRKIELILEPGTPLDTLTLARLAAQAERDRTILQKVIALLAPGLPELFARVTVLTARVQGLAQQDYPASNIFISFETESAQRKVLNEMSVGTIAAWRNKQSAVQPHCLFRNEHVLNVNEPDEPSTVRWQDLNVRFFARLKQLLYTTAATVAAIILIALIIRLVNDKKAAYAAIVIAIFNSLFPMCGKWLTSLESHASEGSKQTSLYFKIAAFRWVSTAIVITVITPFTETIEEEGLINAIYAIFFAEIVTTNAIQLVDPMGHIQRHFLAPRAATQDLMNLNMQGQVFELAERYTNMTKILFLGLWYSSIFPAALFFCAVTLFVNYFTDRFALMRTWKRPPQLGTRISKFSRRYFFSTAILAMSIVSAYYWSGFPYDNLCENETTVADEFGAGTVAENSVWEITTESSSTTTTVVSPFDSTYRYCLQDLYRTEGRNFPALSAFQPVGDEWMTSEQETVTNIYGWTSVAVLVIVILKFIWGWLEDLQGFFRSTYKPSGKDQEINFSDVPSINTYVPQVQSSVYAYPLLACNVDDIDEELFDWTDPDRPYEFYDLTKDADELLAGLDIGNKHVFSVVSHWPPEKKQDEGAAKESD